MHHPQRPFFPFSFLLLLLHLLLLLLLSSGPIASSMLERHTHRKLSRVRKLLKRFNKPAIHSIQSPDGDIIDCILPSQQPAFDHPQLRHHKPKTSPKIPNGFSIGNSSSSKAGSMQQLWHSSGMCPKGSIPVRRTNESDLLRTSELKHYGRKRHHPAKTIPARAAFQSKGHQHAITYVNGDKFYGAKAVINVWDPAIRVENEFSLSQIWILSGSFEGDLNSIEAGWQVSPDLYGDKNTRLFTYWTSDAYQATGCYNLLCSGFVQVSDEIAIGATISPVSLYDSKQFDISILLWKDPKDGDWWMSFGDDHVVGYWPSSLFNSLADSAGMVEWGGEVVDSNPGGQHTTTQMGSGHFPLEGFGKSAYFSNLQIVDASNNLRPPSNVKTYAEQPGCYNIQNGYNDEWGTYFYYGGPGWNQNCQ